MTDAKTSRVAGKALVQPTGVITKTSRTAAKVLLVPGPQKARASRTSVRVLIGPPLSVGATYGWGLCLGTSAAGFDNTYWLSVMADAPQAYWRFNDYGLGIVETLADQEYPGEGAAQAFDGNQSTAWTHTAGPAGWVRAKLSGPLKVNQYSIAGRSGWDARNPSAWQFQGSNDGTTWTTLDTQTGQAPAGNTLYTFTFANTNSYLYYRLNITANRGDASICNLSELQFPGLTNTPIITDSTPYARHGAYLDSPSYYVPGLITDGDHAVSIAGLSGRVPYASWMDVNTFSVEAWINSSAALTGQAMVVMRDFLGNGGSDSQWRLSITGSKLTALVWHPTLTTLTGNTTLLPNVTYHLVMTYDGTTLRIFVNGALDGSVNISGPVTAGQPITFGNYGGLSLGGASPGFNGILDEVAFYDKALSPARVSAHYAAGVNLSPPTTYAGNVLLDGPQSYYRFNESSGTSMKDASGYARDGSYAGGPTFGVAGLISGDSDPTVDLGNTPSKYGQVSYANWMNPSNWTYEALIKPTSSMSGYHAIVSRDGGTRSWSLYVLNGQLTLELPFAFTLNSVSSLTVGNLYHVAVTYDGNKACLYLNGVLEASIVYTIPATTNDLGVGKNLGQGTFTFPGLIDELAFYSSALSVSRIQKRCVLAGLPTPPAPLGATTWDLRGLSALPSGWTRRGVASEAFDPAGMAANYAAGQGHVFALPVGVASGTLETKMLTGPLASAMAGPMVSSGSIGAVTSWYNVPSGALALSIGSGYGYDSVASANAGGTPAYPVWFRVRFANEVAYSSYSFDGTTWSPEASIPRAGMGIVKYLSIGSIYSTSISKYEYIKWIP